MGFVDETLRNQNGAEIARLQPPFPLAAEERRYGEFLLNKTFPPQFDEAKRAFERSLVLDPLSSRTWMGYAEVSLYSGNVQRAERALEMSDALDPNYPRERLESIRLWVLLGNTEKALHHGERIASLGGNNPRHAVEQLVESGIPLAQVVESTNWSKRSPSELHQVLRWFREERGNLYGEAVNYLPAESLLDQAFLNRVTRMAVELGLAELAHDLWAKSDKPAIMVTKRIPLPEPMLQNSPFREDFPLGWMNPNETKMTLRWRSSLSTEGGRFQALGIDGPGLKWEWFADAGERSVVEVARTIMLAGEQETLQAFVQIQGVNEGLVELEAAVNGVYYRSPASSILPGSALQLSLSLPASDRSEVVRLNIIVRPRVLDPDARRLGLLLRGFAGDELMPINLNESIQGAEQSE